MMKTYTITIPAYTSVIDARSEKEALADFWDNYDLAQEDPEWGKPIIKITDKKHGR